MSLSIVLSDQAANIVQAHLANYGSVKAVIESALNQFHASRLEDPENIEYLRQAIREGLESPTVTCDFEALKAECHKMYDINK